MPAISVIVPVYQAEALLPQCVESVLAQTFSDWELLLIDDGSRDGSPTLCDGYAARDPRIRVFHKPNGESLFETDSGGSIKEEMASNNSLIPILNIADPCSTG